MQLYIGNKNYSSWSMRPWVLMRQSGIAFEEVMVRFDAFTPESQFKQVVGKLTPTGKVPVLDDDGFVVWDTLAISEYLAERYPDLHLWPEDPRDRARARCVCAEMHAGFSAMREHLAMNIEAHLPEVGRRVLSEHGAVRTDVARITQMWEDLLARSQGPMLFGRFTIADAYFAPVVMRLVGYGIPTSGRVSEYVEAVCALPAVQAWRAQALQEHDFVAFDEPYRTPPSA